MEMTGRSKSERTACPECNVPVRVEDVPFTARFACPNCRKEIRISDAYRRYMNWTIYVLSFVIPYLLGARYWWLLIWWLPCIWVLAFVWAYVGKYFIPPRLEACVFDPPSILGIGPGSRDK